MNKLITQLFSCSVFAFSVGAISLLDSKPAEAFCIYNNSSKAIDVAETNGSGSYFGYFSKKIAPGTNACCNWKNKGCNVQGNRDSLLNMLVFVKQGDKFYSPITQCGAEYNNDRGSIKVYMNVEAGGYIVVSNQQNNQEIATSYNVNGSKREAKLCDK